MSMLDAVKTGFYAAKFFLIKHAPTILTIGGTALMVGGTVYACKGTLEAKELLEQKADEKAAIEAIPEDQITEKERSRKYVAVKKSTLKGLAKAYWPAATMVVAGGAAILSGHGMMKGRNAALATTLAATTTRFKAYRDRVREALGEEEEQKLAYPTKTVEKLIEHVDPETGEITSQEKVTKDIPNVQEGYSIYARWFDEANPNWRNDPEENLRFLKLTQSQANDTLKIQGYLFLNDVYKMLGIPLSKAGQSVGWRYRVDGKNDGYIDFGLDFSGKAIREFINGWETNVLLDFNVDGPILDKVLKDEAHSLTFRN